MNIMTKEAPAIAAIIITEKELIIVIEFVEQHTCKSDIRYKACQVLLDSKLSTFSPRTNRYE